MTPFPSLYLLWQLRLSLYRFIVSSTDVLLTFLATLLIYSLQCFTLTSHMRLVAAGGPATAPANSGDEDALQFDRLAPRLRLRGGADGDDNNPPFDRNFNSRLRKNGTKNFIVQRTFPPDGTFPRMIIIPPLTATSRL